MSKESKDRQSMPYDPKLKEALEEMGYAVFTFPELQKIIKAVPDGDILSVLPDVEPQLGEGPKVAIVTDSKGKTHRVPLKPH